MQLFDLLSLFYAFLGARAIYTAVKNWRAFTDEQLTAPDRRLASELAFFVLIPIGVLFHELGHAAATYQVGGRVDWLNGGFHYALFFGYIIPLGRFTALQDWWIALSGNLVSVVYGFLPLVLLRFAMPVWLKYMLLAFARIQLGWSLVGYPLITFAGFEGDWTTIYFSSPLLGILVFVAQAALVIALWLIDRSAYVKRWEVSLYAGAREQLLVLENVIHSRASAADPLISRGNFYAANGQPALAVSDYRAALKLDAQNSRALYNLGQIRLQQRNYPEAAKQFRGALARAGSDADLGARVNFGLGIALYHAHDVKGAIAQFSEAIGRNPSAPEYYFWRGTAYRAMRDDTNARTDFARAAELAKFSNPDLATRALEMLQA